LSLNAVLGIPKEDARLAWLLFLSHLFMTSAVVVGRTVSDALFLSSFGVSQLSYMYLFVAVVVSLAGVAYHRIVNRYPKHRLLFATSALIALVVAGARILVGFGMTMVVQVVYVAFALFNALLIMQFWTFANDRMNARQARRLIGLVGAGGIIGGVIGGFGVGPIVRLIGTLNLMFLYMGLVGVYLVFIVILVQRRGVAIEPKFAEHRADTRRPPASRHLRLVAVITSTITIALILIDFRFKTEVQRHFHGAELAAYLGGFFGFAGLLALVLQVFLTNRILARFGILVSLLILPVYLLLATTGLIVAPSLLTAVLANAGDKVLADTIFASTSLLMYVPMPSEVRGRSKIFIDGVVKPLSKGVAAILLIGAVSLSAPRAIGIVVLLLLVACTIAIALVKQEYVKALFSTLKSHRLDFSDGGIDLSDASAIEVLVQALASPEERRVLYCLETLRGLEHFELTSHLPPLLDHASAAVRIEALKAFEGARSPAVRERLVKMMSEEEGEVRQQAVRAVASYGDESIIDELLPLLTSDDVRLRGTVTGALMKHYGIDGILHTVEAFKGMLDSADTRERVEAARVLGYVGVAHFYQPLILLLDDTSRDVQLQAIAAARAVKVPALIPHLIRKLSLPETRSEAIGALSEYSPDQVLPALARLLDAGDPSELSLYVPRVCERIVTIESVQLLSNAYQAAPPALRGRIVGALEVLRRRDGGLVPQPKRVQELLRLECEAISASTAVLGDLRRLKVIRGGDLFLEAVSDRQLSARERLFKLLGLIHEPRVISAVERNLADTDPRRRANALEILDNLLRDPIRRVILSELGRMESGAIDDATGASSPIRGVRTVLSWNDNWIIRCLAHAATADGFADALGAQAVELIRTGTSGIQAQSAEATDRLVRTVRSLRRVELFSALPGGVLATIAGELVSLRASAGTAIFHEGDAGDSFYVLLEGKLSVDSGGKIVATLGPGDCFGEMAVLDRELRSATILVDEDSELYRLDSSAFFDLIGERIGIARGIIRILCRRWRMSLASLDDAATGTPLFTANAHLAEQTPPVSLAATADASDSTLLKRMLVLKGIDLFSGLSGEDLFLLASVVDELYFRRGETIVVEGDPGDAIYGVSDGVVSVRRGKREIEQLGAGAYFGEMSLLDGEPRSASVVAALDTAVLRLGQEDFYALLADRIEITLPIFAELIHRLRRFDAS